MKKSIRPYVIFILINLAAGSLVGWIASGAMQEYAAVQKSALTPPPFVFPIVWTILYVLMGISAALIDQSESPKKAKALRIYAMQLIVNLVWSFLFFNLQMYGLSFFWLLLLWLLIIAMIASFRTISKAAAILQIPYLIWVSFAGYLAFFVWMMN